VLKIVALVPEGKVVSYGQIAMMAGYPRAARQVGWVLHGLPKGSEIPWQRVINTNGYVPSRGREIEAMKQTALLRGEGIDVDDDGKLDITRYRWDGRFE
jgi:methylated-DNA-protein-cysteine methyltransferase-like protein